MTEATGFSDVIFTSLFLCQQKRTNRMVRPYLTVTKRWNIEHPDSNMELYPEDRIVSDKIYAELMKKEKEAYAMGWEKSVLWEMFMHSNRKDLLEAPLEKILEEMEKVDHKTLERGWD